MDLPSAQFVLLLADLVGVFFFALSGAVTAARQNYDITGSFMLCLLVSLGGGITRDLMLNEVPASLQQPIYLLPPAIATVLVYLIGTPALRTRRSIIFFDACGLGLFAVSGTIIALTHDLHMVSAVFLGIVTGTGGGLLRDVVANQNPALFKASDLYLTPAFIGALLTAILYSNGIWSYWIMFGTIVLVVTVRLLAIYFRWQLPSTVRGWTYPRLTEKARRLRELTRLKRATNLARGRSSQQYRPPLQVEGDDEPGPADPTGSENPGPADPTGPVT
ncbi:trimeric intracellular cation channel family protein [Brevibacterium sp. UMB1308A]|uniref:trimeric intracellular cation channel family protein n=1 Tax=Brevibacterium sp. UMB1308A TaxID=3050608 RepID=UPI002549C562|nr:trimeric intracellular cation channel family protein [Brevibacterium sp. UMB1308A]MDK8346085.1 trimeric intracellular cation channel family protein [Brevibacterium sp. UMB1308B]MDK8713088.1 trimeric intracellular cation channel family protein [Brevibacterium sp. UMB1308A]